MNRVFTIYIVYLLFIWSYFIYFYPLQTFVDTNYAAIAHAVFFSKLPLEWILLYSLLKMGWANSWVNRIEKVTSLEWLRTGMFSLLLVAFYGLIQFPLNFLWYRISLSEGTRVQPFMDWFGEQLLDLFFFWIMLAIGIYIVRLVMAKFNKSWWIVTWLLALPVVVFVIYVQPVWIDPLYEDFTEMEAGPLRAAIEEMTVEHGLEDATLLQVNMSEKVTTFNAYVTGIMDHARIVMWDTTLEGMSQEEILFILAHEIGHYVKHHVYIGVAGYLFASFVLFFIAALLYPFVLRNWKGKKTIKRPYDLRATPVLLFILSILLTVSQPFSLFVSRQIELSADRYAIEHTERLEPAMESYMRLAQQSKSDINPVFWVKWMRYGHPTIKDRIQLVEKEIKKRETNSASSS